MWLKIAPGLGGGLQACTYAGRRSPLQRSVGVACSIGGKGQGENVTSPPLPPLWCAQSVCEILITEGGIDPAVVARAVALHPELSMNEVPALPPPPQASGPSAAVTASFELSPGGDASSADPSSSWAGRGGEGPVLVGSLGRPHNVSKEQRAKEAVSMLKMLVGCTSNDLSVLITTYPQIFLVPLDRLPELLSFLAEDLGISDPEGQRRVLVNFPQILRYDVKGFLRPQLAFLRSLGETDLGGLVRARPAVLGLGIERSVIRFLQMRRRVPRRMIASLLRSFPVDYQVHLHAPEALGGGGGGGGKRKVSPPPL